MALCLSFLLSRTNKNVVCKDGHVTRCDVQGIGG